MTLHEAHFYRKKLHCLWQHLEAKAENETFTPLKDYYQKNADRAYQNMITLINLCWQLEG